jgi:acetylornithine/succinyldiaminopimelate/putrescine aminotransferase
MTATLDAAGIIDTTEHAFFPVFSRTNLVVERASGSRVWDVDGREFIDLTSGWGVTALGHCHPVLVESLARQLSLVMQAPNCNLSYTRRQAEAVERLVAIAPRGLRRVLFTNSGTEATEGAIRLVRRATGKAGIIACHGGYHGRTIGAASLTSGTKYRLPFEPVMPGVTFVPFGDGEAVAAAIDEGTAAIIVEPIQGEGGVNVPPPGYLKELRGIASRHGVLLIFDEIQTGIGRTGAMFASMHEDVAPDIALLGKCLGGGFPVGGIMVSDAVAATIQKGDHGGTYPGSPLACAAVSTVIRILLEEKILEHCTTAGEIALDFLRALKADAGGLILDVRGRGLLIGCELLTEAAASAVMQRCLEEGVIVNVTHGSVLRIFPALNVELPLLMHGLEIVREAVLHAEQVAVC